MANENNFEFFPHKTVECIIFAFDFYLLYEGYMIKKFYLLIAVLCLLFASCGKSMEERAQNIVDEARAAYEKKDYGRAKSLLDSVRATYPKAFKARREALSLQRDVEWGEQSRSLGFCDEQIARLSACRDTLIEDFVLEKDARYQDTGNYMIPSQTGKYNRNNTYLRAQVSENGVATLSSVYRGKAIEHTAVRVASGGSYAECSAPFNKYTSRHLGVTTERLDFRYGQDGGLMQFVALCSSPVTVSLTGKSKYEYTLRAEDAAAISKALELAEVLHAMDSLKNMRDEIVRHMEFIENNRRRFENESQSNEQPL